MGYIFLRKKDPPYGDVDCPHCGKRLQVEWTTEYGRKIPGSYEDSCAWCGKTVKIEVDVSTSYNVT